MNDASAIAKKILELLEEVESYQNQKDVFISALTNLFHIYQAGELTYFQYSKERDKILKDKTRDEWLNGYNAYIYSVLKKVETLNQQLFHDVYNDRSFVKLAPTAKKVVFPEIVRVEAPKPKAEIKKKIIEEVKKVPHVKAVQHTPVHAKHAEKIVEKASPARVEKEKTALEAAMIMAENEKTLTEIEEVEREKNRLSSAIRVKVDELHKEVMPLPKIEMKKPTAVERLRKISRPAAPLRHEEKKMVAAAKRKIAEETMVRPKSMQRKLVAPKKTWLDKFIESAKPGPMARYKTAAPGKGITMSKFFGWDLVKVIRERSRPSEAIGKKTEMGGSTILFETRRRRKAAAPEIKEQMERITSTALTEEAKRIRSIIDKRKALKIYKPTFFGALANVMTKRISLWLLEQFPDFFKGLYQALRLANIKILSNTYVNMMVFGVIASSILGFIGFGIVFAVMGFPVPVIFVRAFFMAFVLMLLSFASFYAYPFSKAKSRRLSINTNMSFAVNHMAAVASSGVPPTKMFRLIAESSEYGEIAVEAEKIVNYIEIFGYDFLTAVKSVAVTTPSPAFREFFNGMISTTQSGGDVKSYLSQKAG
ncbi:MAG: type II secretion system F family protein, partial [Candidatus Nanoarchaeia archaeon]